MKKPAEKPNNISFTASGNHLLSLTDIASWQVPGLSKPDTLRAVLPALQRGAVWKSEQAEALWDSLFRGFPVGSFLLTPFRKSGGNKSFTYQASANSTTVATHHLLDGQQRSNTIALGFLNPWEVSGATAVLWLDLQAPAAQDDKQFAFRLLSRAHPWGYRLEKQEGGPRLASETIRDATVAYAQASPKTGWVLGAHVPVSLAWPWDAHAPVPVALLLEAVQAGGDVRKILLNRVTKLPFWTGAKRNRLGDGWTDRVRSMLIATSGPDHRRIERIIQAAQSLFMKGGRGYQIPALELPILDSSDTDRDHSETESDSQAEQQDPVETLFIRVNSGGTILSGEELIYSILKSTWPEAERAIDALDVHLAVPSRIVTLACRLVLASEPKFQEKPPAAPDVARFRRLVHGVDRDCPRFREKMLKFFKDGTANSIFRTARDLLTRNTHCNLPPVLAADIARRSPDTLFLLLRWIHRMQDEKIQIVAQKSATTVRLLGAVTALSWFAENEGICLSALWPRLQAAGASRLPSFFSNDSFSRCYPLVKGNIGLLPLVPPSVLEDVVEANILGYRGFKTPDSYHWKQWDWESFVGSRLQDGRMGSKLHRWYAKNYSKMWNLATDGEEDSAELDVGEVFAQAWRMFAQRVLKEKNLVLFAQRDWLVRWFPDFDPTTPDQLEETDRPWDMDHIHPRSHVDGSRNVPKLIKRWHGSIGNLRAWPLQANRGDGNRAPARKLSSAAAASLAAFQITTEDELLSASAIERADHPHWIGSAPVDVLSYLGKPGEYGRHRLSLVQAIVTRSLRLYRTWYETLRIEELGP